MTSPDPVICDINTSGEVNDVAFADPLAEQASDTLRWIHMMNSEQTTKWLQENLPAIAAQALTAEQSRPRVAEYAGGIVLILRGVNLNPGADPEDMVGVRVWMEENRIVTICRRGLMAIGDIRGEIERGVGPRTPGEFARALAYRMTERMEPIITDLADRADALEDLAVDEDKNPSRSDIAELRREAIMLRRYIAPQKDALNRLSTDRSEIITEAVRLDLREAADRVTRIVEELDAVRERCAVLNDQLVDQRAEEMNRNMFLLSIVAAIFLPLGFLTGLLGVNVGGIPGADNGYAFTVLCLLMAAIGVGIVALFRKLKWL